MYKKGSISVRISSCTLFCHRSTLRPIPGCQEATKKCDVRYFDDIYWDDVVLSSLLRLAVQGSLQARALREVLGEDDGGDVLHQSVPAYEGSQAVRTLLNIKTRWSNTTDMFWSLHYRQLVAGAADHVSFLQIDFVWDIAGKSWRDLALIYRGLQPAAADWALQTLPEDTITQKVQHNSGGVDFCLNWES